MPKLSITDLLPAPFAWIDILDGYETMQTDEDGVILAVPDQPYCISKYPVTNAQFAQFMESGGYSTQKWWTDVGWDANLKGLAWNRSTSHLEATGRAWTAPRMWHDGQFNGVEQPVVGVSWYEAVAFCLWLSDRTGENIMLPTEAQWQYAAQGSGGRVYPWGFEWDGSRCSNSVNPLYSSATTPVRQYEGKGDSPFGVVDMAGNVWEWCLTDYVNMNNNVNSDIEKRVLRGGGWDDRFADDFRVANRNGMNPGLRYLDFGFRVSCPS